MHYEKQLEKLNEYQREAVLDESNACIVNANVGSGKTTVLISKIIYLHYAKNISYKDMIILTFTNKAANEIKERLISADNNVNEDELDGFGTFHSVALNLLKNVLPIEKIGYTKDFLVIEPEEELDIALQIIAEEKLKIKYKNRLKKRLETAMYIENEEDKVSKYDDDIFKLVELLKEEKIIENKMSFDDILKNTEKLLNEEEESINPKWIIIDEVQDSDKSQLDLIDKLKKEDTKLFAVGDSNQVIYSWRGSTLNAVFSLMYKYKARELSLPMNYRSSSFILEAAKYFQQSGERLVGARESGNKIIVKNHYNPFNEACYLADKIKEIHDSGVKYSDIAIFYRLQNQSKVFEDVFTKNEIPYEVSMKKNIRDIPVLNWVIKVFRYSLNSEDLSSGIYVLSNKDYGENMTEKGARKIIKEQNVWMSDLFRKMQGFLSECSEFSKAQQIYDYFEFDNYIRPTSSTYKEDKEFICTLLDIIIEYINEKQMTFIKGLTEFINSSALNGINILKKDINSDKDCVKLMTLHASKGLEFSYVFITGVNYGLIPLATKNMNEEEEEERLFFVGITRAKDYLELSYYTDPDYYRASPGESRFIHRIPKNIIENENEESHEVNLKELKKLVQEEKSKAYTDKSEDELNERCEESVSDGEVNQSYFEEPNENSESVEETSTADVKMVKHKKYGVGKVISEDDMMIVVEFENYGEKEFIKAFSELEEL